MRDPRWITLLFELFVRLVGAGRFARAAYPLCGAAVSGMLVTLWPADPTLDSVLLPTLSEVRRVVVEAVTPDPVRPAVVAAVPAAKEELQARVLAAVAAKPEARPIKLDREQANLAQFIASRYRVALDNTQLFVDGAYKVAREYKMDPWLLLAVMAVESSFDPDATSHRGAHGLMQVLTRVHAEKFAPFGGVAAAFDPIANIKVGARILRDYIARDGSVEGGLKAYVGAALLDDDRGYGWRVMAERERLAAAAAGKPIPNLPARQPVVDAKPAEPAPARDTSPGGTTGADSRAGTGDAIRELLGTAMPGSAAAGGPPAASAPVADGSASVAPATGSAASPVAPPATVPAAAAGIGLPQPALGVPTSAP